MDRMSVLVLPGRCWQSVYFSCRDKWDEKDETTFSSYCGFILVGTSINRSQDLVLLPDMDHSLYIGPWRVVVKVTIYCAAFVLFETWLSNKRCPLLPCMHISLEILLKSVSFLYRSSIMYWQSVLCTVEYLYVDTAGCWAHVNWETEATPLLLDFSEVFTIRRLLWAELQTLHIQDIRFTWPAPIIADLLLPALPPSLYILENDGKPAAEDHTRACELQLRYMVVAAAVMDSEPVYSVHMVG